MIMPKNEYTPYNDYSQRDKESMRTAQGDKSNTNEATLIAQTDDVESLLGNILTQLQAINANTDALEAKVDAVVTAVNTKGGDIVTAVNTKGSDIVTAIEALPHSA